MVDEGREMVARHEAGHAVAAVHFGCFADVTIKATADYAGICVSGFPFKNPTTGTRWTPPQALHLALVVRAAGGAAATAAGFALGFWNDDRPGSDLRTAWDLANQQILDPSRRLPWINKAYRDAERFVRTMEEPIKRVADRLLEVETIEGRELLAMLGFRPDGRPLLMPIPNERQA